MTEISEKSFEESCWIKNYLLKYLPVFDALYLMTYPNTDISHYLVTEIIYTTNILDV